jgi:hypothetical protein
MSLRSPGQEPRVGRSPLRAALFCVLAFALLSQAPALAMTTPAPTATAVAATSGHPLTSALLEQCQTSSSESERSATFGGEMQFVPGTARMQMRIDVLERSPGDARFRSVTGPGVGAWLGSSPGVRAYRLLRQVTNLSAPAAYRGAVRYRWLNARGHVIRSTELLTPACQQPVNLAAKEPKTAAATGTGA